jgi:4-amino-4-deoxy-L-arabinose transferase-like glycosyltransferase
MGGASVEPSRRLACVRDGGSAHGPLLVAAVSLVALVVRAIAWQRTGVIFNDGPTFIGLARLIEQGHWAAALAHPFHPLYPAAIAAMHPLFGSWESAAVAVSALSGAIATAVLFVFLRHAFDLRIAYVGAVLLAFHPYAVSHSADVQSDGLYGLLFLSSAAGLWLACSTGRSRWALATGVLAGLAYWVRPEGVGIALIGIGIGTMLIATRRWSAKSGLTWIAALGLGAAICVAPYVFALHEQSGRWMLTQKKTASLASAAMERSPLPDDVIASAPFLETVVRGPRVAATAVRPAGSPLMGAPGGSALELLRKVLETMGPAFVGLALIGVLFGIRRNLAREGFIALLCGLYLTLLYALVFQAGYVSKRHTLPLAILLFGYVAAGTPVLGRWLLAIWERAGLRLTPDGSRWSTLLGVALVIGVSIPTTFQVRRADRIAEREAAVWLSARSDWHGGPVAAGKQRVAYYAGAPHVRIPDAGVPDPLTLLKAAGAEYLIVDDHYLEENPALRRASEVGMRVLHRTHSGGHSATVYAFEKSDIELMSRAL